MKEMKEMAANLYLAVFAIIAWGFFLTVLKRQNAGFRPFNRGE